MNVYSPLYMIYVKLFISYAKIHNHLLHYEDICSPQLLGMTVKYWHTVNKLSTDQPVYCKQEDKTNAKICLLFSK